MDNNSEFIQEQVKQGKRAKSQRFWAQVYVYLMMGVIAVLAVVGSLFAIKNAEDQKDRFLIEAETVLPAECEIIPFRNTRDYIVLCDNKFRQLLTR